MKVIGIDPGLADTGIGLIRGVGARVEEFSFGSIHTRKQLSTCQRLNLIYSKVYEMLQDMKPDLMIVEDVFSLEKYPASGITLGKVSGVVLLAGCQVDIPVVEIPVREAKQVLTGNGNATKAQLEKSVREYLNLSVPIRPSHAADATALALIGLLRSDHLDRVINST
jgi:crossover junction endodeoxyribonuclease RuvC